MITPRSNFRAGDRIGSGLQRTFASAAAHQNARNEEVPITLPTVGAAYAYRGGRLYRDGQAQPARVR